jgi:hypothetical protein
MRTPHNIPGSSSAMDAAKMLFVQDQEAKTQNKNFVARELTFKVWVDRLRKGYSYLHKQILVWTCVPAQCKVIRLQFPSSKFRSGMYVFLILLSVRSS